MHPPLPQAQDHLGWLLIAPCQDVPNLLLPTCKQKCCTPAYSASEVNTSSPRSFDADVVGGCGDIVVVGGRLSAGADPMERLSSLAVASLGCKASVLVPQTSPSRIFTYYWAAAPTTCCHQKDLMNTKDAAPTRGSSVRRSRSADPLLVTSYLQTLLYGAVVGRYLQALFQRSQYCVSTC